MTRDRGRPYPPVEPQQVVREVRALLEPVAFPGRCDTCSSLATRATAALSGRPQVALVAVASILDDPHLRPPDFLDRVTGRAAGPECDYDLLLARDAAVLGQAGVPSDLAWGPGHRPGMPRPHRWRDCAACRSWVTARTYARAELGRAGVTAGHVLGPDDDPDRFLRHG